MKMKVKRKYKNGGIDPEKKDKTNKLSNFFRGKQKQIQIERKPNPKMVYRKEGQKVKKILIGEGPGLPGGKSDVETKPNWNKKLSRLTNKRTKKQDKGKDTTRVQKRINKEYYKINPKMKGGGTLMKKYSKKFQEGGLNDEMNTGTDTGIDTNTDTGMDTSTDTGIDTNTDTSMDTSTDTGMDTSTDTGMDTSTDTGMDTTPAETGPTRAQLRNERKMARINARNERKMVRTEARQKRKADRLAARQERRGRRQDRKDQRQEARISKREDRRAERQSKRFDRQQARNIRKRNRRGNFEHGGMPKGKKGGMGIIIMVGRKSNKKSK
jgi:hypothetical protein